MQTHKRTRMSTVGATMAFLLVWAAGLAAPAGAKAQGWTYGARMARYYYTSRTPTTYYPARSAPQVYPATQPAYATRYTQPATNAVQPTYTAAQPAANATSGVSYGDAYGFTAWLNGVRARYGLRPVSYDGNLESWAHANNAQQARRGLGHFVMGPARRQNAAIGNAGTIGSQWMNSPAHRAALLDPSITRIGLAGSGSYWTFNAY